MANNTAYGFYRIEHLFAERVTAKNEPTIQTAVQQSAAMYNQTMAALLSEVVMPTTDYQLNYQLASSGELQPLDDAGNPLPVRPAGTYTVAFPIRGGGTAFGMDRIARAKATVADFNRITWDTQVRDARWMRRSILSALFTNVAYTYADEQYGNLTVQPLALTSDGVTYVRNSGDASTDEHFYAQAASISNAADPFPAWYAELNEHPNNNGPYVAYIADNLVSDVQGLADFHPADDPNIAFGADVTRAAQAIDVDTTPRNAVIAGFGDRYLGYHNAGVHVVSWSALPSSYALVVARGGDPVLGMRQHPEPELQGLFPEIFDVDGNHRGLRWLRYAGFGVMNRVGALAARIGNVSYAIPSGFDAREI